MHLVDSPFEQPLGRRTAAEVWARQVRWARLRRKTFPPFFALEILTGCLLPVVATVPADCSRPSAAIVKATMVSLSSLATNRVLPEGSSVMKRGVTPRLAVQPSGRSESPPGSTAKAATLSCPLLEA